MYRSRKAFFTLLAILIASGVWLYFGSLDIVVPAQGVIKPSKKIQMVQHLEGGIIRSIEVEEGHSVAKGDPLIILDTAVSDSELNEIISEKMQASADLIRLESELENFKIPQYAGRNIDKAIVDKSMALFYARKKIHENRIQIQLKEIIGKKQELKEIQERLKKNKEFLNIIEEKIAISTDLMKDDLTNKLTHLNYLEKRVEVSGRIKEDYWAEKKAGTGIQQAQLRIKNIEANFTTDTAAEINTISGILKTLSFRLRKYEDSSKRTIIRSPMDGKIKYLYYSTVGGVVSPGAVVLELVPSDGRLVVEAKLSANEVVYVKKGQTAKVRLMSSGPAGYGVSEGVVEYISADSIVNDDGYSFYIIKIRLNSDSIRYADVSYKFFSGETVMCHILTGKRNLASYFVSPFSNFWDKSLTER